MSRVVLATVVSLLCSSVIAADSSVILTFWAGPGATKDKRVTVIEEHHACAGKRAYARVTRMPVPGTKGALQPEVVVELSPSGSVISRWSLPVDGIVLGVGGKEIVAPYRADSATDESALFISRDRSLRVGPRPSELPKPTVSECPRLPEFKQSAYLRCFAFVDLESKTIRRLAYQMPCT